MSQNSGSLQLTVRDLAQRLKESSALGNLSEAARTALAELATLHRFGDGDQILRQGDTADRFFILLHGRVKMSRDLPNGRRLLLALFESGEIFGTVSAFGATPCDATLSAMEGALCLEIRSEGLLARCEREPRLVREIVPLMTCRLVECRNCLVELSCSRVEQRFAHLLLKLADNVGRDRDDGLFLPVPLSRQDLADMTGTALETTIRVMSRWGKEGLVETRRDGFLLLDRAALEALRPLSA